MLDDKVEGGEVLDVDVLLEEVEVVLVEVVLVVMVLVLVLLEDVLWMLKWNYSK